jgi:hypothetical protein
MDLHDDALTVQVVGVPFLSWSCPLSIEGAASLDSAHALIVSASLVRAILNELLQVRNHFCFKRVLVATTASNRLC